MSSSTPALPLVASSSATAASTVRWSKASQDRLVVLVAALIAGYSALRILMAFTNENMADTTSTSHKASGGSSNALYYIGFLLGSIIISTLVPHPWIRPTYGVSTLNSFESEMKLASSDAPLNRVQVVGTHNSVHVAGMFSALIPYWQYTHPSLIDQLNTGIRHLEIDLWYNKSFGMWEVWHECVDRLTVTALLLRDVLSQLFSWSKSNEGHFPLSINLDIKGAYTSGTSYLTPWLLGRGFSHSAADRQIFQALEREILAKFPIPNLLTPASMLLGSGTKTLRDAIQKNGWPSVKALRGKTQFQLNLNGCRAGLNKIIPSSVFFKRGHNFQDPEPDVGWFETNDPAVTKILIEKGYLVRALDPHGEFGAPGKNLMAQYVATNHPSYYKTGVLVPLQEIEAKQRGTGEQSFAGEDIETG
mmetsp:Transcript_2847/g.3912  ORF Transcript_2847/g.3912 Transcript_2847/m.3912 type:complete len:418 (+) Transcript_2847:47-1300(+)